MAIRTILTFPDPRLRTKARPVKSFDKSLHTLVDDMWETMYDAEGIGLAATQVDVHKQVVVMEASPDDDTKRVLINPLITPLKEAKRVTGEEGCLSVPGFRGEVTRLDRVHLAWQDLDGVLHETSLEGLEAICVQHECDHLKGRLYVDYLSSLKRQKIHKALKGNA